MSDLIISERSEKVIEASARIIMLREQMQRINAELPEAERVLAELLSIKTPRVPSPASPKAAVPKQTPSNLRDGSLSRSLLALVSDRPLTTTELFHELKREYPERITSKVVHQLCLFNRKKGLIEKRECPETRLDKWFVVNKKESHV